MGRLRNGSNPSGNTDWETPDDLLDALEREFLGCAHAHPGELAFDLDPCPYPDSEGRKGISEYSPAEGKDGLTLPWYGTVFVNPPYGRDIDKWVEKCYTEVVKGNAALVVALLPVSTDTRWWHWWVSQATEVRLLKGRIRFVGAAGPAPFASAIVVWRRGNLGWGRVACWDWRNSGS